MKALSHCRSAVVFAGFLWAAHIACAGLDQAQTSTQPDAATPPQTEVQAAKKTPKEKPVKSSEWHHFGEGNSASMAGQSDQGAWRQFGPNPGTPMVVPPEATPRQTFTTNRPGGLERLMWALVNRERLDPANSAETGGRAQPLKWNEKLAAVARAHSLDMLEQGYFSHVDPQGRTLKARINAAGIPWRALGENMLLTEPSRARKPHL